MKEEVIPVDIIRSAEGVCSSFFSAHRDLYLADVAAAIMAERQRCAKIAEEFPPVITETMELPPSQYDIATAIRTQKEN